MFTIAEAQDILGLKRARIMQLIRSGELASTKELDPLTGSKRYISLEAMEQFRTARMEEIQQKAEAGESGRRPKLPKLPD